ncbi:MAG: phosphoesterase [Acidobacteriales bacterium]|nr:phosphoesterase [Terriglobales bacterium]
MLGSIRVRFVVVPFVVVMILLSFGCGGGSSPTPQTVTTPVPAPGTTSSISHDHVFLVVLENHSYSSVIGNPAMPYLNGLAQSFGLATNYFANSHPSLPNYFVLTSGQTIATSDDFVGPVPDDNVVRQLNAEGKTWRAYAQSLPSVGYTGGDQGAYVKHHNPFAYFSDVLNSAAQTGNIVPFSQFASDLQNNSLPNYSYIVPDNRHNAHDCPNGAPACTDNDQLAAADAWLRDNIGPLVSSSAFQGSGLLVITFDESIATDTQSGGGHVATVVISSKAKTGFQSSTFYQHQSVLRLMLRALGVNAFPGAASGAPDMDEFFK